jgi:hypothetical protein
MISHHLASNSWTIRMDKGSRTVTAVTDAFDLRYGLVVVTKERGAELTPGSALTATDSTTELECSVVFVVYIYLVVVNQ